MKPKYTAEEVNAIDKIVAQEKSKGKVVKVAKDFSYYRRKNKSKI